MAVLIGTSAILGGCSSGYSVNLAEISHRPIMKDQTSARPAVRQTMRAPAASVEVTGSIVRTEAIRPWPKRGTAEYDQIRKDELARERRINDALGSICRGC
jgi:hypothetical protein